MLERCAAAIACLTVGCATGLAVDGRSPTTTVHGEAHQLIAVGAIELAVGTAMTIAGGHELANPDQPTSSTMIPGTEGQGLSGDGWYKDDGSGWAGLCMLAVGPPTTISGIGDLATGFYELVTGKFVRRGFF